MKTKTKRPPQVLIRPKDAEPGRIAVDSRERRMKELERDAAEHILAISQPLTRKHT